MGWRSSLQCSSQGVIKAPQMCVCGGVIKDPGQAPSGLNRGTIRFYEYLSTHFPFEAL